MSGPDDSWCNDRSALAELLEWMHKHDGERINGLTIHYPASELPYFLRKPWKWTLERDAMRASMDIPEHAP